jgi:hypothetical protein
MMSRDQTIVAVGAATGVAAMIVAIIGICQLWPINAGPSDAGRRLAFTPQAFAFAVLPLLISVLAAGNDCFSTEAIDPGLSKERVATQINGRVADNTLGQSVLFWPARQRGA